MAGDLIDPRAQEMPYVEAFVTLVTKEHMLPLFALHGNNEPPEAMGYYREAGVNIHLETKKFGQYSICGIGGFGYLNEPGFEDLSVENLVINEQTIFVTHVPPRKDRELSKGPLVHIFGHRHVLAHTKLVGQTLEIQCPAGILGRATELTLPSLEVKFIELLL